MSAFIHTLDSFIIISLQEECTEESKTYVNRVTVWWLPIDMWTLYYRCEEGSPVKSPKVKVDTEVDVAKKEKKLKKKTKRERETSGGSEQVWGYCRVTYSISHVTDTSKVIPSLYNKPPKKLNMELFLV